MSTRYLFLIAMARNKKNDEIHFRRLGLRTMMALMKRTKPRCGGRARAALLLSAIAARRSSAYTTLAASQGCSGDGPLHRRRQYRPPPEQGTRRKRPVERWWAWSRAPLSSTNTTRAAPACPIRWLWSSTYFGPKSMPHLHTFGRNFLLTCLAVIIGTC
jgi:hypothetical protein